MRSRSAAGKEKSTVALVMGKGWQSGISSPVRLAAMMPARRATSSTSPLARPLSRIRAAVAGAMRTRPLARASRSVSGLALVSTMRAAPCSSKWVRSLMRGLSIARNVRVDLQRPGVDAAGEGEDVGSAEALEQGGAGSTANAVVAVDDDG